MLCLHAGLDFPNNLVLNLLVLNLLNPIIRVGLSFRSCRCSRFFWSSCLLLPFLWLSNFRGFCRGFCWLCWLCWGFYRGLTAKLVKIILQEVFCIFDANFSRVCHLLSSRECGHFWQLQHIFYCFNLTL